MRGLLVILLLASNVALAQDQRVIRLEQDVRTLERQVQSLQRQLDSMRYQGRTGEPSPAPEVTQRSTASPGDWLNAANWKKLKVGASEADVIQALGTATSVREEKDQLVMFYAMEIGASGYLSGNVRLKDGKVVSVEVPTLK